MFSHRNPFIKATDSTLFNQNPVDCSLKLFWKSYRFQPLYSTQQQNKLFSHWNPSKKASDSTLYIHNQSSKRSALRSERGWYSTSTHAGIAPGAHRIPPSFVKKYRKSVVFLLKKSPQPPKNWISTCNIENRPILVDFEEKKNPDPNFTKFLNLVFLWNFYMF